MDVLSNLSCSLLKKLWHHMWTDFDFVTKTVRINNPAKHGNARIVKISDKVIAIPQNQGHSTRHETIRPQVHQQHPPIHSAHRL